MVAPYIDFRGGDAENFIYFVLLGLTTRPTLPASVLNSIHSTSRPGRLLAITKISSAYPQICVNLFRIILFFSRFFRAWVNFKTMDKRLVLEGNQINYNDHLLVQV